MQSSHNASSSSSTLLNRCPCLRHLRICSVISDRFTYRSVALRFISNSSCSSGRSNSSRAFIIKNNFRTMRIRQRLRRACPFCYTMNVGGFFLLGFPRHAEKSAGLADLAFLSVSTTSPCFNTLTAGVLVVLCFFIGS